LKRKANVNPRLAPAAGKRNVLKKRKARLKGNKEYQEPVRE
jgi:hypothetical protein